MLITNLKPNQILVVGTNLSGFHGGGAAAQSYNDFGLQWGFSEGICGQSYGFPTLKRNMTQVSMGSLQRSRDLLYKVARENPDKEFLLTPVGTGIARFNLKTIQALFKNTPKNITKLF